jgi:hypothetical protein
MVTLPATADRERVLGIFLGVREAQAYYEVGVAELCSEPLPVPREILRRSP